jgi:microcystin-dependent protein
MGLETGTYIDSLNSSNPTASDAVSEGDDHLRLIKSTVKATFPNLSNAVTSTHTELNLLDGVTANTTELNYVDVATLGTAEASKALTVDSNKDFTGVRNATFTGTVTIGSDTATTLQAVYPVGSIYINAAVATNPGTLLGFGTWVAFGAGRVMVGIDASQTEFDTLEETGGAKTHTLSEAELPSHTHAITGQFSGNNSNALHHVQNSTKVGVGDDTSNNTQSVTVGSTGSGTAHNNLQPYIVVYMWKRTV